VPLPSRGGYAAHLQLRNAVDSEKSCRLKTPRFIRYILAKVPARYSRRIISERDETTCPLSFAPSLSPSVSPTLRVGCLPPGWRAVSEFWRSTKGWEPFMVRIPNPDTTLPHTCTSRARLRTRRARVRARARAQMHRQL